MKRNLLFILVALLPVVASAYTVEPTYGYDVKVNGIYYKISDNEATVSFYMRDENLYYVPVYEGDVVIPSSITVDGKTYAVTSIGSNAFRENINLNSVTLPESVTSIEDGAFSKCTGLTSIAIPESVTSIGEGAFANCSGLTAIGNHAYDNCIALTSVNISSSVTSIGEFAFYGCKSLAEANVPGSVKSIGEFSFSSCSSLTSVNIPESVTSIGAYASPLTPLRGEGRKWSMADVTTSRAARLIAYLRDRRSTEVKVWWRPHQHHPILRWNNEKSLTEVGVFNCQFLDALAP